MISREETIILMILTTRNATRQCQKTVLMWPCSRSTKLIHYDSLDISLASIVFFFPFPDGPLSLLYFFLSASFLSHIIKREALSRRRTKFLVHCFFLALRSVNNFIFICIYKTRGDRVSWRECCDSWRER